MTRLKLATTGLAALLLLAGLLVSPMAVQGQNPSAEEIMTQAKNRWQGEDFASPVKLTTVESGGGKTVLDVAFRSKLAEASRESEQYRYNVYARVTAPDDSEGLTLLVHEKAFPTRDDIWLHLPALDSTKSIVPEDFRNPLFGSEFVFEDVVGREPSIDTHELQGSETLTVGDEERQAWVVKSMPNNPDLAGFAYRISYIGKDSSIQLGMDLFNEADELIKRYRAQNVDVIQDIPTWTVATAENMKTGRKTTFEFADPKYNTGVSDKLFDPKELGSN
ncbi:MAG: outer membrane lipoprotein-sorting protein [Candidatus Bipolaricaulia bacterium]